MRMRILRFLIPVLSLLTIIIVSPVRVSAQQDLSSFTQAFQVFMNAKDAYKTFNISPDDVIYSLPPAYRLGPGDILQIVLTGMINDSLVVQVGPQGDIYVPPAGVQKIDGMTVEQAKDLINSQISKYLRNYDLGLQLLRARRITVYLLGQVRQPGSYIAIAGTSALGVIQTAGTLVVNPVTVNINEPAMMHPYFRALTSGAGRRVQIWRNNQMVTELDLAAMAISGKMGDDIILEDGDALFVPPNQKPVVVRGGVSRPGTYEVAPDDTVFDILAQAGGYKSMMMLGSVEVERPNPSGEPGSKITELDLRNPSFDPHSFAFQSGDILRVPETKSKVYVMGAVWLPQAVDFHEGWNALDYIAAANGVVAPADTAGIRIISFPLTDQMSSFRFNFKNLILGKPVQTVPIEPGDLIYVPWKNQQWVGPGLIGGIATVMAQISGFARLIHDIKIHVG